MLVLSATLSLAIFSCKNDGSGNSGAASEAASQAVPTVSHTDDVVGTDQTGQPLKRLAMDSARVAGKDSLLSVALAALEATPGDAAIRTDIGRRYLELGRYSDAVRTFTEGIQSDPASLADYRYRGEAHFHLQEFDRAMSDLEMAKELTKQLPNQIEYAVDATAQITPVYNIHFSSFYYLGLIHFIRGDFEQAGRTFGYAWNHAENPDLKSRLAFWLALSFKKQGKEGETSSVLDEISTDISTIQTPVYRDLCTLYRGYMSTDDLLIKYGSGTVEEFLISRFGVGIWFAFDGQTDRSAPLLKDAVATGLWTCDVYPVAQAELNR